MENNSLSSHIEKQRAFSSFIKEIQISLNSKEYKKLGYTFNEYVKMKWSISQAQAYRYLICGKVLDQLEEFEIKPSYERLCKSLYNVTKNQIQMKLLWSAVLKKTDYRPEPINSNLVTKTWNELCRNEKYSSICKNEGNIITKVENSINKFSIEKRHKQLKRDRLIIGISSIPSPTLSEPLSESLSENSNIIINNIGDNEISDINILLSPVSDCSSFSNNTQISIDSFKQFDLITIPTTIPTIIPTTIPTSIQTIPTTIPYMENSFYIPSLNPNELYYKNQQPLLY
ncbi:hypothetical protein H8356DRAFT_1024075 [Neocallimastix lanati (nom. inval.)]|nr:hypothetical protein H8356DRAFT_1024075 [Neocallimastix sp. JGI-2020a]